MNPYQSPIPIEDKSPSWLRLLLILPRDAFVFSLGWTALLSAALILLVVMPVAIGLAWYQFRKSCEVVDLVLAMGITFMLPLWQNAWMEAWGELALWLQGRIA